MKLSEMRPEELLNPNWLNDYNKSIDVIWHKLVRLNSNLLILERIASYIPGYTELLQMKVLLFWSNKRREAPYLSVMKKAG